MKRIQTVLGYILPEELGVTMMHEHLLWDQSVYQSSIDPDSNEGRFVYSRIVPENMKKIRSYNLHKHRDNAKQYDFDEAADEVIYLKEAGGSSLVDCGCLGIEERNVEAKQFISKKTGINVIMATGMYFKGSCPEVENMSFREKTDMFVRELTEGVGETKVKAGVIGEIGISGGFPDCEKQTLAAAACAQNETGAAILIHQPGLNKTGHHIIDVVEDNGGSLERTVLCHCDPMCDDIEYLQRLLSRGVNLSFDQFGIEAYLPSSIGKGIWLPRDIDRIRAISRLCELGYYKQLVLSQDLCFKICYIKNGGGGYAHILNNILPIMKIEGIREEAIEYMLVKNPARILAME